ncbi:hypothetical protein [Agarivorans gilvus]|uniref:hypothetical protein n=1 Tax=Agarivorans gilvus TaxID=680279 RepID=UPI0006EC2103|nr:hypothetical protein [Agarivorans gilvus]
MEVNELRFSREKAILWALISLVFVAISLWVGFNTLIGKPNFFVMQRMQNILKLLGDFSELFPLVNYFISTIGFFLFSCSAVVFGRCIFKTKPLASFDQHSLFWLTRNHKYYAQIPLESIESVELRNKRVVVTCISTTNELIKFESSVMVLSGVENFIERLQAAVAATGHGDLKTSIYLDKREIKGRREVLKAAMLSAKLSLEEFKTRLTQSKVLLFEKVPQHKLGAYLKVLSSRGIPVFTETAENPRKLYKATDFNFFIPTSIFVLLGLTFEHGASTVAISLYCLTILSNKGHTISFDKLCIVLSSFLLFAFLWNSAPEAFDALEAQIAYYLMFYSVFVYTGFTFKWLLQDKLPDCHLNWRWLFIFGSFYVIYALNKYCIETSELKIEYPNSQKSSSSLSR